MVHLLASEIEALAGRLHRGLGFGFGVDACLALAHCEGVHRLARVVDKVRGERGQVLRKGVPRKARHFLVPHLPSPTRRHARSSQAKPTSHKSCSVLVRFWEGEIYRLVRVAEAAVGPVAAFFFGLSAVAFG